LVQGVTLRTVQWRDWRYLARLSLESFPDATPLQLSRTLTDSSGVIVLEVDRRPAGYAAFWQDGKDSTWLDWVVVDARHRGLGYGVALVGAVEAVAARRGCSGVAMAVLRSNERAIRLYRSLGYEEAGGSERKLHLRKELIEPGSAALELPAAVPRLIRAWYRVLYRMIVGAPRMQG
jgi:ribosomal protein S18 acetylase RimI-like enzyme